MQVFGMSDRGRKRQLNEDNFSTHQSERVTLAVVADGMGGANAGEVASRLACKKFMDTILPELERISEKTDDKVQRILEVDRAIAIACESSNNEIFSKSSHDNTLSGMGTTIVGCVIIDSSLWAFNIGDSRVYHVDTDGAHQLTTDHSFVQALLDAGKITPEEAVNHPNKNIIVRAVGIQKNVECDIVHSDVESGYYLICSDGLSNYFEKERFLRIINSRVPLSEKTEALIEYANESGGADNITAVLIDTEVREVC